MRVKYPKLNPLRDLEPKEVADVVDTLRDQTTITYDEDDGSVKYGEHEVVKRVTFAAVDPAATSEEDVEIAEIRRFSDFANVRLRWTQKRGSKSYAPRIIKASPTMFTVSIDGNQEEITGILEIKGI